MSTAPTVRTVMLVDDAEGLRRLVAKALVRSGAFDVVAQAGDGHQALILAEQTRPQVILLDLSMPVMDGLTALPQLAAMLPSTVIVVFSAVEHDDLLATILAKGAAGVIDKAAGTPLREIPDKLLALCEAAQR